MKPRFRPSAARRAGFTLVELLAVIFIIALLASLTAYGISRARVAAKQAKCASQLRAIGQGFAVFLSENRNIYPGSGTDAVAVADRPADALAPGSSRWMYRIGPYMGMGPVVMAKLNEGDIVPILDRAYRRAEFHSPFTPPEMYDMTSAQHESLGTYGANSILVTSLSGYAVSTKGGWGIRATDIAYPSQTILLGERYAGVNGDGTSIPTQGWGVNRLAPYPTRFDGLSTNAGDPEKGVGPTRLLMADFSVRTIRLESLQDKWDTINTRGADGIRFSPQSKL